MNIVPKALNRVEVVNTRTSSRSAMTKAAHGTWPHNGKALAHTDTRSDLKNMQGKKPVVKDIEKKQADIAMSKLIENTSVRERQVEEEVDELVAPHEWDALLDGFETENEAEEAGISLDPETDRLWEKLSSARWLQKRTVSTR